MKTPFAAAGCGLGRLLVCSLAVASVLLSASAYASGERSNVRGMGMARTFVATARGLDAVGINPAGLAHRDDGTITFDLVPLGVHLGSDFLTYDLYTSYFTGIQTDSGRSPKYLNDQDKQRILDAFNNGMGKAVLNADVRLLGFSLSMGSLGTVALTATEQFGGYADVPRDYVDFLLYGNLPGTTLDFSPTAASALWWREYALSYGRELPSPPFLRSLAAGISVKLIHGFGYYDVQRFNTSLATAQNGTLTANLDFLGRVAGADPVSESSNYSYSPFPAPAGVGYGIDLGVSGELTEFLSVAASVTDIGSVTWTRDVEEKYVDTTFVIDDPFGSSQSDAVENALDGKTRKGGQFITRLPTQLRMGVALQVDRMPAIGHFPGELLVALDYNQGFFDSPLSTVTPRASLGVEYSPIHWLPIRTGVSVGGTDGVNVAFGLGFHVGFFDLDVATENFNSLVDIRSFSHGSAALGMRLRF